MVYVVVSVLTPRPAPEQLENLCWDNPLKALSSGKFRGATDPRVMAGALLVIVIVLYSLLH